MHASVCSQFPIPTSFILNIKNCINSHRHFAPVVGNHKHSLKSTEDNDPFPPGTLQSDTTPIPKVCFGTKKYFCFSMGIKQRLARLKAFLIGLHEYFARIRNKIESSGFQANQPLSLGARLCICIFAQRSCHQRIPVLINSNSLCMAGGWCHSHRKHFPETRSQVQNRKTLNSVFQTPVKHLQELRLRLET